MDRRNFLLCCVSSGLTGLPLTSNALLNCGPFVPVGYPPTPIQQCEAGIDSSLATIQAQENSQWCWAACIAMVFGYYNHPVSQTRIVGETWGTIVNMPAQPGDILSDLNRPWIDNNGNAFSVSGDTYTANPITAAQDLAGDMPLIVGTLGHAVVLTSLRYLRNPMGTGQVTVATVRDPWPGRGRRDMTPAEWYSIMFAARIRVT